MNYIIKVHISQRYLDIRCSGAYDYPGLEDTMDHIFLKCRETKIFHILFDFLSVEGSIPDLDKYRIGVYIAEKMQGKLRMAILDRHENINKFGETTSRNRGAMVKVFHSRENALEWLL
jgi:hypothetical protein